MLPKFGISVSDYLQSYLFSLSPAAEADSREKFIFLILLAPLSPCHNRVGSTSFPPHILTTPKLCI